MNRRIKNIGFAFLSPLFRGLAKQLLKRHQPTVIAITGSVGKTSTKRAVAAVVEGVYRTQWHQGNYNSELGLPQALFEVESPKLILNPLAWLHNLAIMVWRLLFWNYPYELLVLELGIDRVGDMELFARYIEADIGIITAVQPAHVAGIGSLETIYEQKTMMANFSKQVIVNGDDELLSQRMKPRDSVLSYGFDSTNTTTPDETQTTKDGISVITIDGHEITTSLVGKHSLLPLLAAWTVGDILDIDPDERVSKLEELQPFSGRMNLLDGKHGSLVIDDSYNAVTPQAVIAALDSLAQLPAQRRLAVLGNMNELGDLAPELHKKVGTYVAKLDLYQLITIGDTARQYLAATAIDTGMAKDSVISFDSPYEAGHYLAPLLKRGDVVLVKGSQNGVFAEETTALLLKNDADRNQLVRQDAFYQKIKHQQFNSSE